jgi:hypothetical protein
VGSVEWVLKTKEDRGHYLEMAGLLRATRHGEEVPVVFLHPKTSRSVTCIVPTTTGKAGLYSSEGRPTAEVQRLLEEGVTVAGIDLIFQGEFLEQGQTTYEKTRRVKNPREAAAYTFGYNHTVFQQRVHDLLTMIAFVRTHENAPETIRLVPGPGAGHWAACAKTVSGGVVELRGDAGDFRFANVRDIHSPDFLPGGAKYIDPFVLSARAK